SGADLDLKGRWILAAPSGVKGLRGFVPSSCQRANIQLPPSDKQDPRDSLAISGSRVGYRALSLPLLKSISEHYGSSSARLSAPGLSITRDNTNSDEHKDEDRGPFRKMRVKQLLSFLLLWDALKDHTLVCKITSNCFELNVYPTPQGTSSI
ncbi:Uncharacterized protein DAT39_005169, partial [Clarias magur]